MRRLQFIFLVLLFSVALTATAKAHAFLDHASPAVGSKVRGLPAEVKVWFSEKLEAALSKLQVFNEAGQQVDNRNQRLDPGNAALLIVSVPPLTPGTYKVVWRVVSVDTHTTQGSFKFEVVP
jgi:methionine-rich copper-binding protein CopC